MPKSNKINAYPQKICKKKQNNPQSNIFFKLFTGNPRRTSLSAENTAADSQESRKVSASRHTPVVATHRVPFAPIQQSGA